ncbi:Glycerate kinase [Serinicoccus hydrothermalis]|uniref:Glycerate kinase n=1 Tax=Serinicoccus hydrothermalis TaxID=1758689 RepID=A0A1B1N9V3_9MICO|nr:Glycerate kinase [Serinicoccus hydrothermalis]
MTVVVDRSGGRLAPGTAEDVAGGWAASAPHADVGAHASHDGGAGFATLVAERAAVTGLSVSSHPVLVPDPTGREVPADVAVVERPDGATAYLDTAQVAGRHLVDEEALADPAALSSEGVGVLLRCARDLGVGRVVVGVGDLACHDGGVGLLRHLGAGEDLRSLATVREGWSGTRLVLATTTEASLLGFHGASASLGEHGVPAEVTQRLETGLGELSDRVNALLPPQRDLLTGLPRRPERAAGAGAGGGVGYALQLLGARTDTGARLLLDELGIRDRLAGALVVLVTDAYDYTTVHEGVVADTARAALEVAAPTVVLAREVSVGRREGMSLGVSGSYAPRGQEDLAALAARVARTWTPGVQA